MTKLFVDRLKPGMILMRDITNYRGEVLLHAGVKLNQTYIRRLIELGIPYINVHLTDDLNKQKVKQEQTSPETKSKLNIDGVSDQVRNQANEVVKDILGTIKETGELSSQDILETKEIVDGIIEEIINNRVIVDRLEDYKPVNAVVDELITKEEIFSNVEDIRVYDEYTFTHCVNVCVMSVIMGLAFRYNKEKLMELGVGSLLHDLGKVRIPKEVLNKPGQLTEAEREEMEKHTQYTLEIIQQRQDISYLSALIAYQHHEKFDGQGYPQGLKGQEIHQYARIVAVADVYDALVTDRAYRPRMYSYQAAEIIQASSGTHFDPVVVKAFMGNIVIYPVGSPVELNNKARGVVVRTNKQMPARPVILIFYDQQGRHLSKPIEIDLTKNLTLFINKVFSNQLS